MSKLLDTLNQVDAFLARTDELLKEAFGDVIYVRPKLAKPIVHPQQPQVKQSKPVVQRKPYVASAGEIIL